MPRCGRERWRIVHAWLAIDEGDASGASGDVAELRRERAAPSAVDRNIYQRRTSGAGRWASALERARFHDRRYGIVRTDLKSVVGWCN